MSASDNLNPEQFGMTQREANEMHGKAIAEHLWSAGEAIFGNMKVQGQSRAYDSLRAQFPKHEVHLDANDDPYVSHKQGPYEIRKFHANIAEIHHRKEGPVDAIHWGNDPTGDEHLSVQPQHLKQELGTWVKEVAPDFEDNQRRKR